MINRDLNIPLGSQHVALLEPMRLKFTTQNEKIVDVEADFGYVHRGIEKACVEKFKFKQVGYVTSRVCGLCSITHSSAYTFTIEQIMEIEVPKRAQFLRILAFELDRIHSHLLCLAHTAESAGYEALFMRIMRDREPIMEVQELLTGNRIHFDFVSIGGVNRDIDSEIESEILKRIKTFRDRALEIEGLFLNNPSLSFKYRGIGALSKESALILNAQGPLARASGVRCDVRAEFDTLPYEEVGFKMIVLEDGDIHSRNIVRLEEIKNSLDMIEETLKNLPSGEISTKIKGNPKGEGFVRIEAPRGELAYYVKGVGKPYLDRVRIKTPTYSNLPSFIEIFKGEEYANIPAILASLDPCMSCTAK